MSPAGRFCGFLSRTLRRNWLPQSHLRRDLWCPWELPLRSTFQAATRLHQTVPKPQEYSVATYAGNVQNLSRRPGRAGCNSQRIAGRPRAESDPDWGALLDAKKYSEAETLCAAWTKSTICRSVSRQKSASPMSLMKGQSSVVLNDLGGGSIEEGYKPEAVKEALKHLDAGLMLAPTRYIDPSGPTLGMRATSRRFAAGRCLNVYKGSAARGSFYGTLPSSACVAVSASLSARY